MVHIVCRGEDFAFVDVVDFNRFQNLRLDEVSDTALGHDRDGDGLLDAANHLRIAHARDPAGRTDICRDAFERHDGSRASVLCNLCLLRGCDVHDDAALQHLREFLVQFISFVCHENAPFKIGNGTGNGKFPEKRLI